MTYAQRIKADPELYAKHLAYNRARAAKKRAEKPQVIREIQSKSRAKRKADRAREAFQRFVDGYAKRCAEQKMKPKLTVAELKRIFDADRAPMRESGKRQAEANHASGRTFLAKRDPENRSEK